MVTTERNTYVPTARLLPTPPPPVQIVHQRPSAVRMHRGQLHYWAWSGFIVWTVLVVLPTFATLTMPACVAGIFAVAVGYGLARAVSELSS